jgi:hypothetical protein
LTSDINPNSELASGAKFAHFFVALLLRALHDDDGARGMVAVTAHQITADHVRRRGAWWALAAWFDRTALPTGFAERFVADDRKSRMARIFRQLRAALRPIHQHASHFAGGADG